MTWDGKSWPPPKDTSMEEFQEIMHNRVLALESAFKMQELGVIDQRLDKLDQHQHQVVTQAVLGGHPTYTDTTKPIGFASKGSKP